MAKQVTAPSAQPQFINIPIGKIKPSPTNPRKFYDQELLGQLAESIREKGVLEPVLVRSRNGHYELIAGERRWRAAKIATLKEVPSLVREMSDDEVLDAQIHENLHRADIHPMDEAFGYQHLLKVVEGLTLEELSRRVAKSTRYVAQRLSLANLIEPAVKDFMEGLITLGHATQLARLSPEIQPEALSQCYKQEHHWNEKARRHDYKPVKDQPVTVGRLVHWISENIALDLKRAPWPLDDATLVPEQGSCTTCQFNTAANQLLFPDAGKGAICTNPAGYKRKVEAWIALQIEKLKAAGAERVLYLSQFYALTPERKREYGIPTETLSTSEYALAENKKTRCEFALPAVFVHGDRRGQTTWACIEPKCKDHLGRKSSSSSSSSSCSSSTGEKVEKSAHELKQFRERKQELFDARVAEPVRKRTLRALLDKIRPQLAAGDFIHFPLDESYFRRMTWEHFLRIPTETQVVIYATLGWNIKTGYGSKHEEKAKKLFDALDGTQYLRFAFLCSVVHYGENLNTYGWKDQSEIVKLAAQHDVPYQLFDARERLKQNPGKKYYGSHERYLLELLIGRGDIKRPGIYLDEKQHGLSSAVDFYEIKREVEEKITPTPFLDGPEGVSLPSARVRFISGEHAGKTGELFDTINVTDGLKSQVNLDGGGTVTVHISALVYVEGVTAELDKRRPKASPQQKAGANKKAAASPASKKSPAKKAGAKKSKSARVQ